jgi:hypothetical protein
MKKSRRFAKSLLVLVVSLAACGDEKAPRAEDPVAPAKAAQPAASTQPAEAAPSSPAEQAKTGDPGAESGSTQATVADVLKLVPPGGKKKTVTFPHKAHTENAVIGDKCEVCHHMADDPSKITGCLVAECHDGKTEDVPGVKDAFHKTCRACHKKVLDEQPDNQKLKKLKKCNGCHAG